MKNLINFPKKLLHNKKIVKFLKNDGKIFLNFRSREDVINFIYLIIIIILFAMGIYRIIAIILENFEIAHSLRQYE